MTKVIGVRFRKAGKVYYFSPGDNEIKNGDHVIVETARGVEYGYVVLGSHEVEDKKMCQFCATWAKSSAFCISI